MWFFSADHFNLQARVMRPGQFDTIITVLYRVTIKKNMPTTPTEGFNISHIRNNYGYGNGNWSTNYWNNLNVIRWIKAILQIRNHWNLKGWIIPIIWILAAYTLTLTSSHLGWMDCINILLWKNLENYINLVWATWVKFTTHHFVSGRL